MDYKKLEAHDMARDVILSQRLRITELEAALRDLLKYHAPHALAGADSRAAQAAWDRAVKAIS